MHGSITLKAVRHLLSTALEIQLRNEHRRARDLGPKSPGAEALPDRVACASCEIAPLNSTSGVSSFFWYVVAGRRQSPLALCSQVSRA